jgi:hypothetical protein
MPKENTERLAVDKKTKEPRSEQQILANLQQRIDWRSRHGYSTDHEDIMLLMEAVEFIMTDEADRINALIEKVIALTRVHPQEAEQDEKERP